MNVSSGRPSFVCQEHLHDCHAKDKAMMKDQELELLQVVSQQHEDLDKVQHGKEEKR